MIDIKKADLNLRPNYKMIPITYTNNVDEFNEVYMKLKDLEKKGKISYGIARTQSKGIKIDREFSFLNKYDVTTNANLGCELLVLAQGGMFRLQYRATKSQGNIIKGYDAFKRFRSELAKRGIRIEDYYIDNGSEVKATIEKPMIAIAEEPFKDLIFENVHHVDIHSSYPSGMAEFIPEWKPTIEYLYKTRKECPENKAVLNYACGYFQSEGLFKAKLAHVSKYAIARNNEKIRNMAKWLEKTGRTVLLYNTDGIWFSGKSTGLKSKELGEFEEDHTNCKFRVKTKGAYEFIENGKYTAVVRGLTKYDKIVPREKWQWGDIYREDATPIELMFDRQDGINKREVDVIYE